MPTIVGQQIISGRRSSRRELAKLVVLAIGFDGLCIPWLSNSDAGEFRVAPGTIQARSFKQDHSRLGAINAGQRSYDLRLEQDRIVDQQISEGLANGDTVMRDGDCALLRDRLPPPWPRHRMRQCCVDSTRFSDGGERTLPKRRGRRWSDPWSVSVGRPRARLAPMRGLPCLGLPSERKYSLTPLAVLWFTPVL